MKLHYGDLTDSTCLVKIINEVQPDEVYNLGAMSHVKVSFDMAEYTGNVDGATDNAPDISLQVTPCLPRFGPS